MAREVIAKLIQKKLLVSSHQKNKLKLGFPLFAIERWFPGLYPEMHLEEK